MSTHNAYEFNKLLDRSLPHLIEWCQQKCLILSERHCVYCKRKCSIMYRNKGKPQWRCQQRENDECDGHDFRESIVKNTVFEDSKFSIPKLLRFFYYFSTNTVEYSRLEREMSEESKTVSHATINLWLDFCREICFEWLNFAWEDEGKIGGEGVVVEIDETKIGKRKYNRGRKVDGSWILGMVEINVGEEGKRRRGGRFRLEICPDNSRSAKTLLALIKKHVLPGSTIVTDCWSGYKSLEENGYVHWDVNHSEEFVNSKTGANTQTVESQWRPMKRALTKGGVKRENLWVHLCEYLWRRYVLMHKKQPLDFFLKCCVDVYNPYYSDDLIEYKG